MLAAVDQGEKGIHTWESKKNRVKEIHNNISLLFLNEFINLEKLAIRKDKKTMDSNIDELIIIDTNPGDLLILLIGTKI